MRKTLAAAAAAALLLAGCTGGGGGSSDTSSGPVEGDVAGEITFQTWSLKNEKFTPFFEKAIADFEKEYPDAKVKWIDQPGDGYEEKILQQAGSGELPDVVNLPDSFAYQLAKLGKLQDLASADPDALDNYVQSGLDGYTFDGLDGTWAYPWYLGTDLNWWNTDILEEAGLDPDNLPDSDEEFFDAAMQVAEKTGGKTPLVSAMPDIVTLENAGVEVWDGEKFTFNTDEAAEVIDKYAELYQAGAMPAEALNNDYAGNSTMFTQGKVGYTTSTPSFVTQVDNDAPNLKDSLKASQRWTTPPMFVQGISVASESKNLPTAMAFAQFITNNDNQVEFVKLAQGFIPGSAEANADPSQFTGVIEDPLMADAVEMATGQMERAKNNTIMTYTDDMKQYFGQQIALALKGDISSKEALDKTVDYCNNAL